MTHTANHQAKLQLTREGFEELKREYEELVNVKRPETVDRLSNARSMGDLSENNDYHNAKEALEFLDGRISELEGVLEHAEVVTSNGRADQVAVGTRVKVKVNGAHHVFHIVGEWEANPKEKKISHESPLGKALIGRKVGEKVEVEVPAGKVIYEILSIE